MSDLDKRFIFTITPGHTGTTFLAEFLNQNLPDSEIYHEIIGWDKFGVDTPDLSHLTLFNSQGNVQKIRDFWKQKWEKILTSPYKYYGETSHLLAKAGMMENLSQVLEYGNVYIICLKRSIEQVILSQIKRHDFLNIENRWLWHLDPNYPKKLVDARPFNQLGIDGLRFWYACEMYTRVEYYRLLFADNDHVHFLDFEISDISDPGKALTLLAKLGVSKASDHIVFPEKKNISKDELPEAYKTQIHRMVQSTLFEPKKIAQENIDQFGKESFWDL